MISNTQLMQQEARSAGAVLVAFAGSFHSPSASAEEESVNTVWPYHANYKRENHEEWELEEPDWDQIANRQVVKFSASDDESPLSTLVAR
ncbi:hypothetical protein PtB15_3B400 [Puccinia triticina]|nr:hypothetical protein PtB15_3B400 [Puccinia triticina]